MAKRPLDGSFSWAGLGVQGSGAGPGLQSRGGGGATFRGRFVLVVGWGYWGLVGGGRRVWGVTGVSVCLVGGGRLWKDKNRAL